MEEIVTGFKGRISHKALAEAINLAAKALVRQAREGIKSGAL